MNNRGIQKIFGFKTFIWVYDGAIQISVSSTKDDNPYEISEVDFDICLQLEKNFTELGWQNLIDRKIEQSILCISKSKYPELFED